MPRSLKPSEQYPSDFSRIGRRTVKEGEWELTLETKAKANYLKLQWYAYARALKQERRTEEWVVCARVIVHTRDNVVIFSDRDKSDVGLALATSFAGYKEEKGDDPVGDSFREMMASKKQLDALTIAPAVVDCPSAPHLPEPKVFHVRVFRDGIDADEHPDTGDYNEFSIHNLFAIYRFTGDEVATVDTLDKGDYCVINDINIRRL